LDQVLNELVSGSTISALEKLFPGTITTINREVNDTSMTVVEVKIEHGCDNELGRLLIEILNSLIEDRKINQNIMVCFFFLLQKIITCTHIHPSPHILFIFIIVFLIFIKSKLREIYCA